MKAKWHRNLQSYRGDVPQRLSYEHVLFVGEWEWRINDVGEIMPDARWRVVGRGVEGGSAPGTCLTKTLAQAKARCEDAALRVVEKFADDLGMKLVPR